MPIELTAVDAETVEEQSVEAMLEDDEGNPTLQAEVLERFLDDVDFDAVFDALIENDFEDLIDAEDGYAKWDKELECYVECDEDDDDAEEVVIETIDLSDFAGEEGLIDLADMRVMFEYYMENELDVSTLQGKLEANVFGYTVEDDDEDDVDEAQRGPNNSPYKKGDFKKLRKGSLKSVNKTKGTAKHGPHFVNRMIGAMLNKGVIKRAKKAGGGDKGSDYKRDKYKKGAPGKVRAWKKYRTVKKAELRKQDMKVFGKKKDLTKSKKKAEQAAYGEEGKASKKSARAAKKAKSDYDKLSGAAKAALTKKSKKKAAASAASKKKKASGKKSKKKLAASVEGGASNLTERENLSAPLMYESSNDGVRLLGRMKSTKKPSDNK